MRVRLKHRRLARELKKGKLSQNAWARRIGVSRGYLSNLVSGRRPYPGRKTREKLIEALGVSFDDLFEMEEEPKFGRDGDTIGQIQWFGLRLRLERVRRASGGASGGPVGSTRGRPWRPSSAIDSGEAISGAIRR